MTLRVAILAGVSTDAQAKENKLSIPEQIKHCRAYIAANVAIETAGPYIMDGYSRTGYDSLEVAMREIPPLALAIQQADQYDVLIMDNYDRLGDLGYIVKTRFKKLRKQLHSVRQSGKLVPPELYDPYNDDSGDISMYVEGIIQTYRINKIRRGWNIGVPNRARNGLPPMGFPYAYKASAKNEPPALIADRGAFVVELKNKFLHGATLLDLEQFAQSSGFPPQRGKRWWSRVIGAMLTNPFYAGRTIYGRTKLIEGKKKIPVPQSQWVVGTGKHIPLWDENTYLAILAEFERRRGPRIRSTCHALTSIVACNACGSILHHHGRKHWNYLGCNTKGHTIYPYATALDLIASEVSISIKAHINAPEKPLEDYSRKIKEISARRLKVQEGYEANLYTAAEASTRLAALEEESNKLLTKQNRQAQKIQTRSELAQFANIEHTTIRSYILNADPTQVNRFLRSVIETITITPENKVNIEWQ